MADLYRRERRRLRADWYLIKRGVSRETRRQIWLNARRDGFTSLKRAARSHLEDHPHGYEIWQQIFPGVYDFENLAARGKAAIRRARKAHHRRAQRERMARHQENSRPRCLVGYVPPDENPGCGEPLPCPAHGMEGL